MPPTLLPPELSAVLAQQSGKPLRVTDPTTKAEYVLVSADLFDELTSIGTMNAPGPEANGQPMIDEKSAEFPATGTADWGQMNRRRADLIRKKLRGELTEAERRQYEWLQRKSREALDAAHPRTGPGASAG
jgi:hypothetical protein